MSGNNSNGGLCWGSSDLVFELTSSDDGLLKTAATVFSPWIRRSAKSAVCRWRVERNTGTSLIRGGPVAEESWVVSSDSGDSSVHASAKEALLNVEYSAVVKCFENRNRLGLHAALLSKDGKGVVIVGRSESGKSTLACSLWQQGWSFLCDDYVMINAEKLTACPAPRRVSVRPASRKLLGERLWSRILAAPSSARTHKSCVFNPSDMDGKPQAISTKLEAVIFLGRLDQELAPAELRKVEPVYALLSLISYSNLSRNFDRGEALQCLQPIADRVPAFDLGRGPLSKMTGQIEHLVETRNDARVETQVQA